MTEIIDLGLHRARTRPGTPDHPAPDLTKHDTPPDTAPPAPREVLEGVVIPADAPATGPADAPGTASAVPVRAPRLRRAVGVTRHVVTHDRTKTAARTAVRHGSYIGGGASGSVLGCFVRSGAVRGQ